MSDSLSGADGSSVLVSAVMWIQGTLLGTVAVTIATIGVAAIGLMMLSGRVSFRHGATVIAGCFILFGASSIVAGIEAVAWRGTGSVSDWHPLPTSLPPPMATPLPRPINPSRPADPYAGASVPVE